MKHTRNYGVPSAARKTKFKGFKKGGWARKQPAIVLNPVHTALNLVIRQKRDKVADLIVAARRRWESLPRAELVRELNTLTNGALCTA